ncbi:hypothetical protein SBA2_110021 [Acidobacteriia bacterium SbA2]|nr:hypothetical protein SBA2_110021 [Acidobacteriia bacterium SbA2]
MVDGRLMSVDGQADVGSPPPQEEGPGVVVACRATNPDPSSTKEGNHAPFSCTVVSRRITVSPLRMI